MAEVIRMPRMSDTMEEGNIVGWLKKVGDLVEPGDVLAEVETDKATMELESYHEGVLLHIGVSEGSVPVNAVLAVIGEEGEDYKEALATVDETNATSPSAKVESSSSPASIETVSKTTSHTPSHSDRIKASPLAKSIAKEAGIDLTTINGTGENGRIVKRDLESVITTPSQLDTSTQTISDSSNSTFEKVPVSQMRKVIASRLAESKFGAPHFYLTIDIEMSKAIKYRKEINALGEGKISFNDLVVKASAQALRKHPVINSSWMGDHIRINKVVNIGVAVAIPDGLLVPVIKDADRKGMSEINKEVKELAGLAKEKKLQPAQMQGNTFTISNLGMFDITEFTAIINPPDACILAVGSIKQTPIVEDGEIKVGNIMKLTLSCDHRVVDGASGAAFLATLKGMLENPIRMIV